MEWFVHAWARTLVQEHAKEVSKNVMDDWEVSEIRRQIAFSEVCGEAGSVCEETVADWFVRLQVPVWTGTCVQCEKILVLCSSIIGWFHCTGTL